ncbi:hypothetical protein ARTSIC4J27_4131 [Pseudarthrobacter siccitolerans]|uniref:Uncharacterized protein n=1 Tax=Pseudarthrobacter siccitolerans TaxID=861266 RepID=A0A024H818_9MICC|nr:hypothetical protein ARTSIC4J27_4131 [Pseudarthrobacter siccitolerans]
MEAAAPINISDERRIRPTGETSMKARTFDIVIFSKSLSGSK